MRPSEAQREAKIRNWRIFRLRGAYGLMYGTEWEEAWKQSVDDALRSMGAEPESERQARIRKELWERGG